MLEERQGGGLVEDTCSYSIDRKGHADRGTLILMQENLFKSEKS